MSNTKELKKYLLEKENAFLLDDINNGKTIMLSGAWGAGKTHFWQNEIVKEDKDKFSSEEYKKGLFFIQKEKSKACVYVSLYGKDSLDSLKKEIYIKASSQKQLLSKEVSTFGFDALSSIKDSDLKVGQAFKAISNLNTKRKNEKGIKRLKDGGIICLDDFERKSNKIDLNDLFGFISQLAIDMNCKIIIILNSDVFTSKEAEVFKNVKEKTVNKFFYFEPTIEELFESISKNKKYDILNDYKKDILETIKETEELNARIYIQVLDNCLEWFIVKEELNKKLIRVLVLGTFNFVLNHMLLDYQEIFVPESNNHDPFNTFNRTLNYAYIHYKQITSYADIIKNSFRLLYSSDNELKDELIKINEEYEIEKLINQIMKQDDKNAGFSIPKQEKLLKWVKEKQLELRALWKYGYRLYYVADVEEKVYNEIAKFIKSGILI